MSFFKTKRSVDTTLVTTSDDDIELSETIEKIQLYSVINDLLIIVNTLVKVAEPNIENSSLDKIHSTINTMNKWLKTHIYVAKDYRKILEMSEIELGEYIEKLEGELNSPYRC